MILEISLFIIIILILCFFILGKNLTRYTDDIIYLRPDSSRFGERAKTFINSLKINSIPVDDKVVQEPLEKLDDALDKHIPESSTVS